MNTPRADGPTNIPTIDECLDNYAHVAVRGNFRGPVGGRLRSSEDSPVYVQELVDAGIGGSLRHDINTERLCLEVEVTEEKELGSRRKVGHFYLPIKRREDVGPEQVTFSDTPREDILSHLQEKYREFKFKTYSKESSGDKPYLIIGEREFDEDEFKQHVKSGAETEHVKILVHISVGYVGLRFTPLAKPNEESPAKQS